MISDTFSSQCEGAQRLWQSQSVGIHSAGEIATSAYGLLAMTLTKVQVPSPLGERKDLDAELAEIRKARKGIKSWYRENIIGKQNSHKPAAQPPILADQGNSAPSAVLCDLCVPKKSEQFRQLRH